jgi:eukaryotic-like serine/threonine-protein kinase
MMAAVGRPVRVPVGHGSAPAVVRDVNGNAYELGDQPVGSGGHGAVYRVRQSQDAVKLLHDDVEALEADGAGPGESLDERIRRLEWLPLDDLPIARPKVRLAEPHVGYLMPFPEDMVPIATLCEPPEGELEPWYLAGGGLRRRLRLLARCAGVLATLHGRGLVYGDISPRNVLVSAAARRDGLWFIDPDNVTVESSAGQRAVATRLYRAPEIARRQGGFTPFSDAYSFAILAYQTLRADHPLIGDGTTTAQLEEDAERGLLPWTGHSTDERNRSDYGIPARAVLTSELTKLFERAFEDGLREPRRRPTALAWLAALGAAADHTVICLGRGCGHSFYAFVGQCPFCGTTRPDAIMVGIYDQIPPSFGLRGTEPVLSAPVGWIAAQDGEPFVVTTRHSRLVTDTSEKQVLRLRWRGDGALELTNIGDAPVRWVPSAGGIDRTLRRGASRMDRADGGCVHFGEDRRIHRVLTFQPLPAAEFAAPELPVPEGR